MVLVTVLLLIVLYDILQHCNAEIFSYNNATGEDITCKPSEDCFIDCNTDQSCFDIFIICPPDKKCLISCNIAKEESCASMMIDATKSSLLTIQHCENDNSDACNNITVHCPTTRITSISCTVDIDSCQDICDKRTDTDSETTSIWILLTNLNALYYVIGVLTLAIFCCCCIILFYIQMSLSYNKTVLKYQMNARISKLKNISNSAIKFGKENRAEIDVIALKSAQKSESKDDEDSNSSDNDVLKETSDDMVNIINDKSAEKKAINSNINTVQIRINEPRYPFSMFSVHNNNNNAQYTQSYVQMNQIQLQANLKTVHKESLNTIVSDLTSVTASTVLPSIPEPKVSLVTDTTGKTSNDMNTCPNDEYTTSNSSSTSSSCSYSCSSESDEKRNEIPVIFSNDEQQIEYYKMLQNNRNITHLQFAMNYLKQNGNKDFVERNRNETVFTDSNNGSGMNHCCVKANHNTQASGIVNSVLGNMFALDNEASQRGDNAAIIEL